MKNLLLLCLLLSPTLSLAGPREDGESECENRSSQDINCSFARETTSCVNGDKVTTYIYSCRVRKSNVHGSCTVATPTGESC